MVKSDVIGNIRDPPKGMCPMVNTNFLENTGGCLLLPLETSRSMKMGAMNLLKYQ